MKVKINKVSDLNSISVLPHSNRGANLMAAQQQRSQSSQHSFSQGVSSQPNSLFSSISQNSSFDEILADNQRLNSQEKDTSARRVSYLAHMSYPRDESQMPNSRCSADLTHRCRSAATPDHKCQLSDELEHKIASMEPSLSKLGMILDSVLADIIQVNKGTKELSLAVEGIRQKSLAHDDSFHALKRELDASFRSLSNQLSNSTQQDKMQEILAVVMNLPDLIQTNRQKLTDELLKSLSGELKEIKYSLKTLNQKYQSLKTLNQKDQPLAILPPKVTGADSLSDKPLLRRTAEPRRIGKEAHLAPKIEMGNWANVKSEQIAFKNGYGSSCKNLKQRRFSPMAREQKVLINLDDDSDDETSCLMMDRGGLENHLMDEVDEEAERILKKARRRKRNRRCRPLALLP